MNRRERALMLTVPSLASPERQERLLLEWALKHRYDVTSIASRPEAATALVDAGLVEVIILVTHTSATYEMRGHAVLAGVRVEELREGHYMRRMERQREAEIAEQYARDQHRDAVWHGKEPRRLEPHVPTPEQTVRTILDAAARGIAPEQIAAVLDLPAASVYDTLGRHAPDCPHDGNVQPIERARRARELTRPAGRR